MRDRTATADHLELQRSTCDQLDARTVASHDRPRIFHWPHTQTLDYHCRHSMAIPGDVSSSWLRWQNGLGITWLGREPEVKRPESSHTPVTFSVCISLFVSEFAPTPRRHCVLYSMHDFRREKFPGPTRYEFLFVFSGVCVCASVRACVCVRACVSVFGAWGCASAHLQMYSSQSLTLVMSEIGCAGQ